MRDVKILCIQLGFNKSFPDVSTLATTYNDGIYYIASFLMKHLPNSKVEMCQMFWGEDPTRFQIANYDYILISALATHFWSNQHILKSLKEMKGTRAKIIIGGPHATFAPFEALKFADFVVLGEGEIPALQLISCLESNGNINEINNIAYLNSEKVLVFNKFARFGSIDNKINPNLLKRAPKLHWATVSMSRGCPYDCSFCYAIRQLGRKFRNKSTEDIREELDGIYNQTGCKRFYVTDLNFTTRKDFCHSVAESVRECGYNFIAMSRIEFADDSQLLSDLKNSGFNEFCLGVESEDPVILRKFRKRVNASLQSERLLKLAENNLYIHSAIIFGLDSQDEEAINLTAEWCAESRILHPTFVCLAEYPFQNLLYGSIQTVEDHRIIMRVPTYQHYSFVGIFPRQIKPSTLQRAILNSYGIFFKKAFEIEKNVQRRMRLKSYSRSVDQGNQGMELHIRFLEKIEKPYYTNSGVLKEDLLLSDFNEKNYHLKTWLAKSIKKDNNFNKMFAK